MSGLEGLQEFQPVFSCSFFLQSTPPCLEPSELSRAVSVLALPRRLAAARGRSVELAHQNAAFQSKPNVLYVVRDVACSVRSLAESPSSPKAPCWYKDEEEMDGWHTEVRIADEASS